MSRTTLQAVQIAAAVGILTMAAAPLVYRDRPPEAHTGGFGEPSCLQCHLREPDEKRNVRVSVVDWPDQYEAGQRYPFVVVLTAPSLQAGGFQLAARIAEGTQRGQQAGHFSVRGPGADVSTSRSGVEYVQHTANGTAPKRDTVRWQLEWEAPRTLQGPVTLNVAANAANYDASPLGDRIVLLQRRTNPRR